MADRNGAALMNLVWIVAITQPDLLTRGSQASDELAAPEVLLAKAMQGRLVRSVFDAEIEDLSVRAVYDAMSGNESGVDTLIESLSAGEIRDDLAKLTALTLVACALLADRDNVPTSLRLVDDALALLNGQSAAVNLCRALLLQQRALRNNDIGEPSVSDLDEVRLQLDQIAFASTPQIKLRPGADCSPEGAVANVVSAVRSASVGFDLDARPPDMGYVASDLDEDQHTQYRLWLSSAYAAKLDRSVADGYGDDLYFTNLRLEVLGHRDVYHSRRELAMMRIVRFMPTLPSEVAADGLRLQRLGGDTSRLQRLVDDLTFSGPLSPLLADGRRIAAHRTSGRALRTGEMIVLAAAAEVMPPSEAFPILTQVLSVIRGGGPTAAPLHWQAEFSRHAEAWAAAAVLAGASGAAGVVARDLLAYATPDRLADASVDRVIAKAVSGLDWEVIDDELLETWKQLASVQTRADANSATAAAVRRALGLGSELPAADDDASLNDLADQINHFLRTGQAFPDDLRSAAKSVSLSHLARIANEASAGTLVGRVVEPAEIAAVLLVDSPDEEIWVGLLEFFTNPVVARSMKSRALDILTAERPYLAEQLAARYTDRLVALISGADRWNFDDAIFVSALNFGYAYELVPDEVISDRLRTLASSSDAPTRRQAAQSLSLLTQKWVRDWMLPTVYSLSVDSDPTVRVGVARALSQFCQRNDAVGAIAIDRLSDLLESGGVRAPLRILAQLTPSALAAPRISQIIQRLRNESPSWRIRKLAGQLVD
ncbi:hypothetical protein ACNO8X_10165 [Mycobacterium sp. PDNC021]|uniref:hypothetical protein n=1 Tax=Mycobacterium sp. PDNC021 TaxID=3391399 RepID=UPI003AADE234